MSKAQIGTIISRTLRPQDLIPALIDEAKSIMVGSEHNPPDPFFAENGIDTKADFEAFMARLPNPIRTKLHDLDDDDDWWHSEEASCVLNEDIWELMTSLCPAYTYFGSLPGDGADFGYWPDIDFIEEQVFCDEMLKVNDWSDVPHDYDGDVVQVNDHGNVTVGYHKDGELKTVYWDCV